MTSYAESRRGLHDELLGVPSQESAAFLMDSVPLAPYSDVARKADVEHSTELLRSELHREVGTLRSELHLEIGGVRSEIGELRSELDGKIGGLTGAMDRRFANVERQFGGIDRQFGEMGLQIARVERSISELQLALTLKMHQQFIAQLALIFAIVITMAGFAFFG